MATEQILSIGIFLIVILAIISERVHRTVAAAAGAVILILLNVVTVDKSIGYIDFNTLGVLLGMMLFVEVVKNSGLFEFVAIKSAKMAKGDPWKIMVSFMLITAILSAFLDNVTTVLLIGPMTITIARMLETNPLPFLITQILSSNIGGTSTLIGDPPNIMIGSAAHLSFLQFIINLGPIIVVIMAATIVCFWFIYGKNLGVTDEAKNKIMLLDEHVMIKDRALFHKSLIMIGLVVVGFVSHSALHIESCVVALTAATVMLLIGKQDPDEMLSGVEWSTILFFMGLFVVVGGMVETGVIKALAELLLDITAGHMIVTMLIILWLSALLSAILDNIPFVATLIPLILTMGESGIDVTPLWWAISLGACLGGNGTLIGASANVVLSGISKKHGHPISFLQYMKIGFPLMILSIFFATGYLLLRYFVL